MEQAQGLTVDQAVSQISQRLGKQGYQVRRDTTLRGRSGANHHFDLIGNRNDGVVQYRLAVEVVDAAEGEGQDMALGEIFEFDNKCYDCGIKHKLFVALSGINDVARRFGQNQRIRVLDEQGLQNLLATSPAEPPKAVAINWESLDALSESLGQLGYDVNRDQSVTGASEAEYVFDALAHMDDGFVSQTIAMEELEDDQVDLNQVSIFDAKAYDAGISEKVLLLRGKVTSEARRFAEHQGIRLVGTERRPSASSEGSSSLQDAVEQILGREEGESEEAEPGEEEEGGAEAATERVIKGKPSGDALDKIPESMARRFNAIPLSIKGNALKVAMANPGDIFALEALGSQSRMRIEPVSASEAEVREAIDFNYRGFEQIEEQVSRIPGVEPEREESLGEISDDTPVASALRLVIDEAAKARASDVHLDPEEDRLRVRYRVDGVLQDVMSLPLKIHPPLTSRIKIMGDMNIADHLRPQDGQFSVKTENRGLDIRVATTPTVHGEMSVLRLLDKSLGVMDLPELGFSSDGLAKYEDMMKVAFGMILLSGPTGSGKTTTLYGSVNTLDKMSRNIITIEDPVEYRFENINQIQVNPRAGLTFASGLRSILRLDPDIILVGEIRDVDTARIAVQSALTGHLMLSSIHANDTVGVIFRLLDLGVEPFLVASALVGVVAQRMVRRVCPDCSSLKKGTLMEQEMYERYMGEKRVKFRYGEGCEMCSHTGYRGRTGLYEVMPISDAIRMQILQGAGTDDVRKQAEKEGVVPLMKEGMRKVKEGVTTPAEVIRSSYHIH